MTLFAHNMRKDNYKKQSGFSLIETLIAVSILMIAIAGPLSLVQAGLFSSIHQRNQVTATYLAQEALEYIKNVRDTNAYYQYGTNSPVRNWLSIDGTAGNDLLDVCGAGCYVDPHKTLNGGNNFIQSVSSAGVNLPLRLSADKIYSYNAGGAKTSYVREVTITDVAGTTDEVTVTVKISWKDNQIDRDYTVRTNLLNYQIADPVAGPVI